MTFASVEDLELRWKTLTEDERIRAHVLLEDASAVISQELARNGQAVTDSVAVLARAVVCSMVKRVMASKDAANMLDQYSQTAGPYQESFSYHNPTGDLYLTRQERQMLGLNRQFIGTIKTKAEETWEALHARADDRGGTL